MTVLATAWNLQPIMRSQTMSVTGQIENVRRSGFPSRRSHRVCFEIDRYPCEANLDWGVRRFLEWDFASEEANVLLIPAGRGYEAVQIRQGDAFFLRLEEYNFSRGILRILLFCAGGLLLLVFGGNLLWLPFRVHVLRVVHCRPGKPRLSLKK